MSRLPGPALAPVTLVGRAVRLEPLAERHAPDLWKHGAEPEIWRYMPRAVVGPDDMAAWIRERLEPVRQGTALAFAQCDPATGAAFGSTSLFDYDALHRRIEIGYTWIGSSHRRTRANTEAKRLLLSHAFEGLGVRRVQLKCDAENQRSATAIARLGAVREGILRAHMVRPDGSRRDTAMFSIVADEWPAVRHRLEEMLATPPARTEATRAVP